MFQPSIGLLSGDWGDDFQIAEGGHLKQSRLDVLVVLVGNSNEFLKVVSNIH